MERITLFLKESFTRLSSSTRKERLFLFASSLVGFLIAAEYATTRPSSHALFLTTFSSSFLGTLWLATVPINFLAISLYNRLIVKWGPLKMWLCLSSSVILINTGAGILLPIYPKFIFIQCIWKDIYILLMFKQMWSLIHSTIPSAKAKYLYGIIFGMGTLGSTLASFIPSLFAIQIGSEKLFYFTLPLYGLLFFAYRLMFLSSQVQTDTLQKERSEKVGSLKMISNNHLLLLILALVVFMQVSSGLMEYRFNAHLEMEILEKDFRTAYCGTLFGITNAMSLFFQMIGSFLLIQTVGIRRIHFLIPLFMLFIFALSWIYPTFFLISLAYVALKSLDFSLFSVSREMLYSNLSLHEKFKAKALIDVFAYRSSKAIVAVMLIAFQFALGGHFLKVVNMMSFSIFLAWFFAAFFFLKRALSKAPSEI